MGRNRKPKKRSMSQNLRDAKALKSAEQYAAEYIAEHDMARFIEPHTAWGEGCGHEFVERYTYEHMVDEFLTLGAFKREGRTIFVHIVARLPDELPEDFDPNDDELEAYQPSIELDLAPWADKYSLWAPAKRS